MVMSHGVVFFYVCSELARLVHAVRALSGCIILFNQSADLLHMYLMSMMQMMQII